MHLASQRAILVRRAPRRRVARPRFPLSEPQGDAAHGRDASSPGGIIAGVIVAVLATVVIEVVPVAVVAKVVVGRPSRVRRVRQQERLRLSKEGKRGECGKIGPCIQIMSICWGKPWRGCSESRRPSRVRRVRQQGGEEGRVWQNRPMHSDFVDLLGQAVERLL